MSGLQWAASIIGAVFVYLMFMGFVLTFLHTASHGAVDADRMMTLYATERDFDAAGAYPNSDLPAAHPMTEMTDA